MANLSTRALEALEWSLVRDALAARTRSPLGAAVAYRHAPFPNTNESARLRQRVLEGRILIEQSPVHGYVSGAVDVSELLDRAGRDGVLDPTQLWSCGHFLGTVGLLGEELRARKATSPHWAADFELAPKTPPVCDKITRSVSSDGLVLDSASADLARLRRSKAEKRIEFEAKLNSKVKEWNSAGLLQDNFYDQVDGRYVVPVKVELQSRLDGNLVARSNTGQSVFIEPAELSSSNNALKEIDLAIRAEEFRILRTLSNEVGGLAPAFLPWIEAVAELDLALAAARLAKDWALVEPEVGPHPCELKLKDVFHPGLKVRVNGLSDEDIVKNTFALPDQGHGLLISGPNTGGKTVLLKAAALASCMARAGLLVPAAAGTRIPHYTEVYAFIGDEQNLSQGLSSFSAQIKDMREVLEDTRGPFLIVIDEILSSTDPEEASALAQAILEELVARGHHVLVTSHFSELSLRSKLLPSMTVAAMEFHDGRPTYRLRLDELGASHALEVARRLGFPEKLITRARSLVSTAKLDYERAQAELKERAKQLEYEHYDKVKELEKERERYKSELRAQVEAFRLQAEEKVRETVKTLSERIATYARQGVGAFGNKTINRIESTAKDTLGELDIQAGKLAHELGRQGAGPESTARYPLEVGAQVKIRSMKGSSGTVLELKDSGSAQSAIVQVGNFRLTRPADDLEVIPPKATPHKRVNSYVGYSGSSEALPRKLDLRGRRYDEAIGEAERYIDLAFRSGAAQVTVVTGHGTGALKKGLKELLAGLPYVREFRPEREGDDGATLIEFER